MISSEVQWIAYQRGTEVPVYRVLRNFLCEACRRDTGYRAVGNGAAAPESPSWMRQVRLAPAPACQECRGPVPTPVIASGCNAIDALVVRHSTRRRIARALANPRRQNRRDISDEAR